MTRRSFIQRLVYSILVMFFGPGILEQLDLEETERFIDEVAEGRVCHPMLFVRDHRLWYRDQHGRELDLEAFDPEEPTAVELSPELAERIGHPGLFG